MKTKKSNKADLENKRGVLFMFGLTISLGMVLLAFEWKTEPKAVEIPQGHDFMPEVDVFIPSTKAETPLHPKPKIEIAIVEIIGNDEKALSELSFSPLELEDPYLDVMPVIKILEDNKTEIEEKIFISVEQMPEFPGGELGLRKYLANAIKYPIIAQENGIMGKVYVSFIINEKGGIENIKLIRGADPALDKEALRVVSSLPHWKPGKQGGKAVKVRYNVPIVFELR